MNLKNAFSKIKQQQFLKQFCLHHYKNETNVVLASDALWRRLQIP